MKSHHHLQIYLQLLVYCQMNTRYFGVRNCISGGDTPFQYEAYSFLAAFKNSTERGHVISISTFLFWTRSGVIPAGRSSKLLVYDRTEMYFQFMIHQAKPGSQTSAHRG